MHYYAHVISENEYTNEQRHSFRRFSTSKSLYKYIEHLQEQRSREEIEEFEEFQVEQAMPGFYLAPMEDNGNGVLCCYDANTSMILSISNGQFEKRVYPVLNRVNDAKAIKKAKLKPEQSLLVEVENWTRHMQHNTLLQRTCATIPLYLEYENGGKSGVELTEAETQILDMHVKLPASLADIERLPDLVLAEARQRKLKLLAARTLDTTQEK